MKIGDNIRLTDDTSVKGFVKIGSKGQVVYVSKTGKVVAVNFENQVRSFTVDVGEIRKLPEQSPTTKMYVNDIIDREWRLI